MKFGVYVLPSFVIFKAKGRCYAVVEAVKTSMVQLGPVDACIAMLETCLTENGTFCGHCQ